MKKILWVPLKQKLTLHKIVCTKISLHENFQIYSKQCIVESYIGTAQPRTWKKEEQGNEKKEQRT